MESHPGYLAECERLATGLAAYLAPYLADLMKGGQAAAKAPAPARALWSRLAPDLAASARLRQSADDLARTPGAPDLAAIFAIRLKGLLRASEVLARGLMEEARERGQTSLPRPPARASATSSAGTIRP